MPSINFSQLQLGDSFFPIGIFNFSQALEAFTQDGFVADERSLADYLADLMELVAWTDGIALLQSYDAAAEGDAHALVPIDQELLATKLGQESRAMTLRTGRQLLRVGRALWPAALAPLEQLATAGQVVPTYPVALGVVARAAGLARSEAFALEMYSTAACVCGAALRLMRVDHIQMQRLLQRANGWADERYAEVATRSIGEMRTSSPAIELEGMRHEQAYVRMFAN